ncbi:MAG: ferredoxin-type protein NapF [Azonexus sp.]|nr:ferredoxin-type protein NapF [Azonexus sp.]
MRTCTRCHACIENCATGLLTVGGGAYPEAVFRHNASTHHCNFCGECVRQCPSAALLTDGAARPWPVVAVIGDACLTQHGVVCHTCRESCDVEAIGYTVVGGGMQVPQIDAERCSGCGECLTDCPTQAIRMHRETPHSLSLRGVA